ncbi:hypothetical protein [Rhizobium tibeticum]|uniref:hypothetical protein n=1 Tax=Rhizobium tibeticum TaxID=501024 RepID=UPI001FCDE66D|nr:hypothetical protein [Rhizobium tibeticum]
MLAPTDWATTTAKFYRRACRLDRRQCPGSLRRDPFEKAQHDSNTYNDWFLDRAFVLVPIQGLAAQLTTMKEYPPRQMPGSFNLGKIEEGFRQSGGNGPQPSPAIAPSGHGRWPVMVQRLEHRPPQGLTIAADYADRFCEDLVG